MTMRMFFIVNQLRRLHQNLYKNVRFQRVSLIMLESAGIVFRIIGRSVKFMNG